MWTKDSQCGSWTPAVLIRLCCYCKSNLFSFTSYFAWRSCLLDGRSGRGPRGNRVRWKTVAGVDSNVMKQQMIQLYQQQYLNRCICIYSFSGKRKSESLPQQWVDAPYAAPPHAAAVWSYGPEQWDVTVAVQLSIYLLLSTHHASSIK